jgi:hypothetical protein
MEPLVPASLFTAGPALVHLVGGVLGVGALAATSVVLVATALEREHRLLAPARWMCAACCGAGVTAGFGGLLPRWGLAVLCVAFLLAVLAIALRYGQGTSLRGYLEARGGVEQPAWWPAFEEGFRRYATGPRREQNPLQRAVPVRYPALPSRTDDESRRRSRT